MSLKLEIKKDTLILYWDGEVFRKASKSLFFYEVRKIPIDLSWEDFCSRFSLLEEKIAKRYALYLLSKRNYLSSDLETKLVAKGVSSEIAQKTVLYCTEKGYLNDAQEVERLFAKGMRKGDSAKATYFKLKQKTSDDSHLRKYLHEAHSADRQNLQIWLRKNARKINRDDPNEMRKLAAKLCRRGFSLELVLQELCILGDF